MTHHIIPTLFCVCNSYNMGMRGLPDIYTQSTRATGPRTEGVYIRQTTSACVTTNTPGKSKHW